MNKGGEQRTVGRLDHDASCMGQCRLVIVVVVGQTGFVLFLHKSLLSAQAGPNRDENSSLRSPCGMDQSRLIFYTSKEAAHCLYDP